MLTSVVTSVVRACDAVDVLVTVRVKDAGPPRYAEQNADLVEQVCSFATLLGKAEQGCGGLNACPSPMSRRERQNVSRLAFIMSI